MRVSNIFLFLVVSIIVGCSTTTVVDKKDQDIVDIIPDASSAPPLVLSVPRPVMSAPPPMKSAPKPVSMSPEAAAAMVAQPAMATGPSGSMMEKENVYYKSYLLSKDDINVDFANFIYFPRKPLTEKEINKYKFICKLWLDSFPKEIEIRSYIDPNKERLIAIYWALTKPVKAEKCDELIDNYDYVRMQVFANHNKLNKNNVQILGKYKNVIVSMNLTDVFKEEDLILAFDVWKDNLTTVPSKSSSIEIYGIVLAAKKVLGVLGGIMVTKFKG